MRLRSPPPARALGLVLALFGLTACASGHDSLVATTDGGGSASQDAQTATVVEAPALPDPGRAIVVDQAGVDQGAPADALALDDLLYYGGDASLPGGPRAIPATLRSVAGMTPLGSVNTVLVSGGAAGASVLGPLVQGAQPLATAGAVAAGAVLAPATQAASGGLPAAASSALAPTSQTVTQGLSAPAPAVAATVTGVVAQLSAPGETIQSSGDALAAHPAAVGVVSTATGVVAGAGNPIAGAVSTARKIASKPINPSPVPGH